MKSDNMRDKKIKSHIKDDLMHIAVRNELQDQTNEFKNISILLKQIVEFYKK